VFLLQSTCLHQLNMHVPECMFDLNKKNKDKQVNEEAIKRRFHESKELRALQKEQEDTFMLLHELKEL